MQVSRQTDAASLSLPRSRRPGGGLVGMVLGSALLLALLGFTALGVWQLQRLEWKRDLIARVEARVHAAPAPPPPRAEWPRVDAMGHEYRRIRVEGQFLVGHDTRVQAVTQLGAGFWLLTPLRAQDGSVLLVNRGFVPPGWQPQGGPAAGPVTVTGLLRMSESGGGFLRRNLPAGQRWYSRDVAAIAAAHGLGDVAPYFIDEEFSPAWAAGTGAGATENAPQWPRGGLTVVQFRDNHLSYALTWFALALMTAVAGGRLVYETRRSRRRSRFPALRSRTSDDAVHAALTHD